MDNAGRRNSSPFGMDSGWARSLRYPPASMPFAEMRRMNVPMMRDAIAPDV
jgi:hypothetical protein